MIIQIHNCSPKCLVIINVGETIVKPPLVCGLSILNSNDQFSYSLPLFKQYWCSQRLKMSQEKYGLVFIIRKSHVFSAMMKINSNL